MEESIGIRSREWRNALGLINWRKYKNKIQRLKKLVRLKNWIKYNNKIHKCKNK